MIAESIIVGNAMSMSGEEGMKVEPIGYLRTCFEEKFGTPRQPGLCPSAWGRLVFHEKFRSIDALRGLEGFSHVWIVFWFHETAPSGWSPTVRPPRLGGNQRVGVFASRSTFRPNSIGLSLCRLEGLDFDADDGPALLLGGVDVIDGTPVLDIKPYLAYAESVPSASCGYASLPPVAKPVMIDPAAQPAFDLLPQRDQQIITEALSQDPRPAVHGEPGRLYGLCLCGVNVRFRVDEVVWIHEISERSKS